MNDNKISQIAKEVLTNLPENAWLLTTLKTKPFYIDAVEKAIRIAISEDRQELLDAMPTKDQIEGCGKQWKKALGIDPYRLQSHLDFQAGATWMSDFQKAKLTTLITDKGK